MSYETGVACEGREDRAATFVYAEGVVLVVADGAGGTGHGAEAAGGDRRGRATRLDTVPVSLGRSPERTRSVTRPRADHRGHRGRGPRFIAGASVGDSDAWWFGATALRLTENQHRKPLLGSGSAVPVGFGIVPDGAGTLVLGSDGLWNYVRREAIAPALLEPPSVAAMRLLESVRYRSGALPDDVSVIVCRPGSR